MGLATSPRRIILNSNDPGKVILSVEVYPECNNALSTYEIDLIDMCLRGLTECTSAECTIARIRGCQDVDELGIGIENFVVRTLWTRVPQARVPDQSKAQMDIHSQSVC